MQGDGNLVLYSGSVSCPAASCSGDWLWNSGTGGDAGGYVAMQNDGNLVIYYHGSAVWSSNTAGFSGADLKLQDDDNLVIYQGSTALWDWGSAYLGNELLPGETLSAGEELISPGHQYQLIMQGDGNLVLYSGSVSCPTASCSGNWLWNSGTAGDAGAYVTMQSDGNLVIYYHGAAVWESDTWGFSGDYLKLQDDNNLVIYEGSAALWDWASGYLGNELLPGETLTAGQELISPGRQYQLIMQDDGNLVLYSGAVSCPTASCSGDALWQSGTAGDAGAYVAMQSDGNLVIYHSGTAAWASNTAGDSGAYLKIQDDSNLVIYLGSTAIWDWGSGKLGSGGGPTAAETSAVTWALGQVGQTSHNGESWSDLCLPFVQDAYADGAGPHITIQSIAHPVGGWNDETDPQDVWGGTFTTGTTGASSTIPPYGALVFFDATSGHDPEYYSHVEIMGSNGEMIGTPGAPGQSVFEETLAQHESSGDYNTYVGWWLPDG